MPKLGRINAVLRPGDKIPADCRIVDAWREHRQYDIVCITIEAEWLRKDVDDEWHILMATTMEEVWNIRMQACVGPLDKLVLDDA